MDDTFENLDSQNQESEMTENTEIGLPKDPVETEPIEEELSVEDLKQEVQLRRQREQELYEQLKKAKGFVRDPKDGKWVKKEVLQVPKQETRVSEDITRTELYSLVKANVPEEDTNEAIIYAKSHGLSVTDALKTDELKAVLRVRAEFRKSAEAASMGGSRKGTVKPTNDSIIDNAKKGQFPEDLAELAKARAEKKRQELLGRN